MQESFFDQPEFDNEGEAVYSVQECHFLVQEAVARLGKIKVRGEVSDARVVRGQKAISTKTANGPFPSSCST